MILPELELLKELEAKLEHTFKKVLDLILIIIYVYIVANVYLIYMLHSDFYCRMMFVSCTSDSSHDWSHSTLVIVCYFFFLLYK